jgi:NADH dehydrogenase
VLQESDLPLDRTGKVLCLPTLQVCDEDGVAVEGAWSAGDCASVPDLAVGGDAKCPPTAQHAVRQAKHLGENIARYLRGAQPVPYKHKNKGTVASLGLFKGVAQVMGFKFRGFPAWFMHRTYHMLAMPTVSRKFRIVTDWTAALFFRREMVALGSLETPRAAFVAAATAPTVGPRAMAPGPAVEAPAAEAPAAEAPVESQTGAGI